MWPSRILPDGTDNQYDSVILPAQSVCMLRNSNIIPIILKKLYKYIYIISFNGFSTTNCKKYYTSFWHNNRRGEPSEFLFGQSLNRSGNVFMSSCNRTRLCFQHYYAFFYYMPLIIVKQNITCPVYTSFVWGGNPRTPNKAYQDRQKDPTQSNGKPFLQVSASVSNSHHKPSLPFTLDQSEGELRNQILSHNINLVIDSDSKSYIFTK